MTKSNTETEEDGDRRIIKAISQINRLGLVTCQLCGSRFCAGDAVSVYAYRPAGESCFEIGHVICGDDAHKLPSYFTLGVRELILEGRVGVVVDVAALSDATAVDELVNLCGLEYPVSACAADVVSGAQDTGGPSVPAETTEREVAVEREEPKVPKAADEPTTMNPGAATELVFVDPAVRAVSGAETTTARFRPPADATTLHSNSPSGACCCVDDPNTDDANPLRNTDSTPRESVSWVYGETMCERARDHDDNDAPNGAANTPQEAAREDTCTPPTGDDSTGGEH